MKRIRIFIKENTRVMTTKLTLTIDEEVIESAKKIAIKKGMSLSRIVANYLRSISLNEVQDQDLSPRVKKLKGSIKLPKGFDYKKELGKAISKKHL
jgi:hypothetical protein